MADTKREKSKTDEVDESCASSNAPHSEAESEVSEPMEEEGTLADGEEEKTDAGEPLPKLKKVSLHFPF